MRILISNDDGVFAEGIQAVAQALRAIGEVVVVAPHRQRSAAGHGITLHKPLYCEEADLGPGVRAYGVTGTPADCVKFGVSEIMKDAKPDLVVSGINAGGNLGNDVLYSGTVSAAIEGAILGFPAIAVSLCGKEPFDDYSIAADFTVKLAQQVLERGLRKDTVLNVNVPQVAEPDEIRGVRVTTLGTRRYENHYEKRLNPRGTPYYWLAGPLKDLPVEPESDVQAIREQFISVSPVHFDLTDRKLMEEIRNWSL
jgi:5'-nucleotidase